MPRYAKGTAPHGTTAKARWHWRHGEKPCEPCRLAENRRRTSPGALRLMVEDHRPVRNGIPDRPYQWRARTYPWAQAVIARAEAEYGQPEDYEVAS